MTKAKAPKVLTRDVSVYLDRNEFVVERSDGTYTVALTSADVVKAVKADDAKLSKRGNVIVVTRLTWRDAYITTGGS